MDHWKIWIDTGGTFTDCIALNPHGEFRRTKVLSSSALRGAITEVGDRKTLKINEQWGAPPDFITGFRFNLLDQDHKTVRVSSYDPRRAILRLDRPLPASVSVSPADSFEIQCNLEAPVLAACLVTSTPPGNRLPPCELRLATTRGTNALLEQKGAPTLFLVTAGFGDLLRIGDQKRPDLFALKIKKPEPIYRRVIEVRERIDADGTVHLSLDRADLAEKLETIDKPEEMSVAICLANSYKNSTHEDQVVDLLKQAGFRYIAASATLSPFIKMLPRAETAVVNAYLSPILTRYMEQVNEQLSLSSFRMMTSAGGLVRADRFNPKDSLLSGPAGGVVGAATVGAQSGFDHVISFDMGGTSTDVARYDSDFDYIFEHRVGDVRLAAPALSIETVAAGGGSVCSYDGFKLTVGPESAGADPGPACYGAGGPLTVTDVNLLLGRLVPENFNIPVSVEAARTKLDEIAAQVGNTDGAYSGRREILEGFLRIANERMADAIRKISLRKGYDPKNYALVAFGGAGAQHACAIAGQLEIGNIVIPSDAGLLSAYGLGNAVIEQFEEMQVLDELTEQQQRLPGYFRELGENAQEKLRSEGLPGNEIGVRRRSVFMRFRGQESTLEIPYRSKDTLREQFRDAYVKRYGHWVDNRTIEVESIRLVASGQKPDLSGSSAAVTGSPGKPIRTKQAVFEGKKVDTPVFRRSDLVQGQVLKGPVIILDPYSTIVLEPEWQMEVKENRSLILTRNQAADQDTTSPSEHPEAVALELFTNRFISIAEEMGEMLRRTALSVNVRERMDFSCALLNTEGELVVNAPHIPVHLGALGLCVRRLKEHIEMRPGDVIVTNHPAYGGSHLPDVTVVTPVFTDEPEPELIGFAANRAHHAEIGGTRPGSMPPDAGSLAEEGVVIPPEYLVREGRERWSRIRKRLVNAPCPTRSIEENMADLQAAVAANHRGVRSLLQLVETHGRKRVRHFMSALRQYAADKMRTTIRDLDPGSYETEQRLDDGTVLRARITVGGKKITFDFDGTGGVHPGNLNATPAIVNSVIIYLLRLLVNEPLPLNEGLLEPVTIHLPTDTLVNPGFHNDPRKCPAIVGGNVETSQRLVDLLLKPFRKIACSQGTMNNVLFGNDNFGYYETIGGGTGAGPDFDGADAVHHHMTNTAGTDPEILEQRYPVRLDRYAIRTGSGGSGIQKGGCGIRREMTFLEPVRLSLLTQHRVETPYGLEGGEPGNTGQQWVVRGDGSKIPLGSVDGAELDAGDRFIILTPGGGGYGSKASGNRQSEGFREITS